MFGKPAWFTEKCCGWGLKPVTWQGWLYAIVWMVAIAAPFAGLLTLQLIPEALTWLGATVLVLLLDVHLIRRQMKPPVREPDLYILDDETGPTGTRNYELRGR